MAWRLVVLSVCSADGDYRQDHSGYGKGSVEAEY
jgi:hypothetical protein